MTKTKEEINDECKEEETTDAETTEAEEGSEDGSVDETEGEKPSDKKEDEDQNTKYLRLMADFQNYKKRAEKERSDIHAFANEKIVTQLLEVMDNFERALDHDVDEGFKEGMTMIFDQLKGVLEKSGVEEIKTEDTEFDPNYHNAVLMEDTDKVDSGKISETLQKGYTLNGKVIRAAMVKVAK
ncbi:MAG: nucleotide exchange factor GrpE [Eubacteriaceae bacterium]|nr:nucleotide exchange factor GrpE [Eubacteriaceae bacterium]